MFEGSDDLNRNEAFEHLARHLGTHFDVLSPFYEKVKRCVATGRGQRIDIDHFSEQERSAAVQFGTLLHRHGMLKDFYYHRSPKKQLRVIPTKDGQIGQFLTGGWLEIYVSLQLWRRLKAKYSPAKFQMLYNVKGTLPDGREFESDLMATVEGRMFWLECKTGNWQDYAARFKGLVKTFGVDRASAALLLIRPPDPSTRQRATDMLDMTLLSLREVDRFINNFLGIEGDEYEGDGDYDDGLLPLGVIPPLSDDEVPLENAEPAKRLGRVDLGGGGGPAAGGDADEESDDGPRRRKRRRRGGRGRGRARDGESATQADGDGPPRSIRELLPIARDEDEDEADDVKAKPAAAPELPPGMVASSAVAAAATAAAGAESVEEAEQAPAAAEADAEAEAKPKSRSRGRRGGRGRRRSGGEGGSTGEDSLEPDAADGLEEDAEESAVVVDVVDAPPAGAESEADNGETKRRRRRPRQSPFAVDEDAAEAAEAAEATEPPVAVAEPEVAEPEESVAVAEPEPAPEPEPEPEPAPAPEPKPAPVAEAKPVPQVRTSPKGVVIAPDLAAMMAGTKKKTDGE